MTNRPKHYNIRSTHKENNKVCYSVFVNSFFAEGNLGYDDAMKYCLYKMDRDDTYSEEDGNEMSRMKLMLYMIMDDAFCSGKNKFAQDIKTLMRINGLE